MKYIILANGPAGVVHLETLRRVASGDDILLVSNEDAPQYSRMAISYLLEGNINERSTAGGPLRSTAKNTRFCSMTVSSRTTIAC